MRDFRSVIHIIGLLLCIEAMAMMIPMAVDLMYGNSQPNYRSVDSPEDKQWDKGGPYKAISDLDLSTWEYATIPRCHGMTILRKRSEKIINV